MDFSYAIWWFFVTATTVGYGNIRPTTQIGRLIASIFMLVCIGFIGMLTVTISTYFLSRKGKRLSYREEVIGDIQGKLDNFDALTIQDINDIHKIMITLKNNEN